MKITIESDIEGEELEKLVLEKIQQVGVFGYDLANLPFQRTIGSPSALFERCCGVKKSLSRMIDTE